MIHAICINNKPIQGTFNKDLNKLVEGKVYQGYFDNDSINIIGDRCTTFVIPSLDNNGWSLKRFVFLSDLDETELVTEEFEEKYCVPVKSKV